MARTVPNPLGLTLRWLRQRAGWSQTELARASGLRTNVLCDYERGAPERQLTRAGLDELAALLGFGPAYVELVHQFMTLGEPAARGRVPHGPAELTVEERQLAREAAASIAVEAGACAEPELLARALDQRIAYARAEAAGVWDRLRDSTPMQRGVLVDCIVEFQTWAVAERLAEESVRAAPRSAAEALGLARLALRAARLSPGDEAWRSRLEGYVRAFVANALRVGGNLVAADEEWQEVRRCWLAGAEGDPDGILPEWRILDLEASQRCFTREFDLALELLDRAAAIAPRAAAGRILLSRAQVLEQIGDIGAAVTVLQTAAPLLTGVGDLRLRWALMFNLTVNLCHLQRFAEAEALLPELHHGARMLDNALDLLHLQWLTGRVAAGLGREEEALTAFELVRDDWLAHRDVIGAAMVSLEIAIVYLRDGQTDALRELIGTLARSVVAAKGMDPEALVAFRHFCQAARQKVATLEQAQKLLAMLERSARRKLCTPGAGAPP